METWQQHRELDEKQQARFNQSRIPSSLLFNMLLIAGFYHGFRYFSGHQKRSAFMNLPLLVAFFIPSFLSLNAYLMFGIRVSNFTDLLSAQSKQEKDTIRRENAYFLKEEREADQSIAVEASSLQRQLKVNPSEYKKEQMVRMLRSGGYSEDAIQQIAKVMQEEQSTMQSSASTVNRQQQ